MFRKAEGCGDGTCVEVDLDAVLFVRADGCDSGTCVEIGACACGGEVLVRDSKNPTGPVLGFTRDEWKVFVTGVKNGEFDVA